MVRVIFLTLGVILLVLGLGGVTIHADDSTNLLLQGLAYIGAGAALMLAAIACAIVERGRQTATPPTAPPPPGWAPPQYPGPGAQPTWGAATPTPPQSGQLR
jgi:hypothetical protein